MSPVGIEPTISAGERTQTYALDCAATGTGYKVALEEPVLRARPFSTIGPVPPALHTHVSFVCHRPYMNIAIDNIVK